MASHQKCHFIILLYCILCVVIIRSAAATDGADDSFNWLNHGGNILNRRYAASETKISPSTAPTLQLKWKFYAGRDISATPAIYNGTVYFPSYNGNLYAVKADDGSLVWKQNLKELTGINGTGFLLNVTTTVARATPTIVDDDDVLIIGITGPAYVIAVKRTTGELLWSTKIENHPMAIITMSGTYHARAFYVGVSSVEELAISSDNCCWFRGSFAKLDARTGAILWKTYMLPDNQGMKGGYAGAAVWGSSPSIDVRRNHVYISTGNLYSAPPDIEKCQQEQNNQTTPTSPDKCIEPDNHSDSILALDMDSGTISWYRQLGGYDVWILACLVSPSNCPTGPNPDADFGEAPMMLSIQINGTQRDIVAAVQKSGFAWALDRENGEIVWSTFAGPGGIGGGGTWGAATDIRKIYTNIANSNNLNFTLAPSNEVTKGGGWVAMNASTGNILWSTAEPKNTTTNPVTVANGVLFAGSTYITGPVYAIDAETGIILWSYETGASVYGGMSVSNGCMYVGHGYRVSAGAASPAFSAGTYLFAFCVE